MKQKSKEFQHLVELTDIVNRHKTKEIRIISYPTTPSQRNNRHWQLYDQLTRNNFKNEQDAIDFFGLNNNIRSYKKIQSTLQKRLINTLFFMDLSDDSFDNYTQVLYQVRKEFWAFQTIYGRGGRTLGIKMGKSILKTALKYQLTEIIVSTTSYLKDYFSKDLKFQKEFERYNTLMWDHMTIHQNELKAAEYYQRFIMSYIGKKSMQKNKLKEAKQYISQLDKIPKSQRSEKFYRFYFLLSIYIPMSTSDWASTIKAANKGIKYYEKNEIFPRRIISSFLLQKIVAEIMLKNYDIAKNDIQKAEKYMPISSKGWMKIKEFEAILYFNIKKYKEAWYLIKSIIKHKRFQSLSQSNQEIWHIFNAYISLVQLLGKVKLSPRETGGLRQFRLSKFLNEVPIYTKDKMGMNISILIVQIMILLYEEKYEQLDLRIESFMMYKRRKLQNTSDRTLEFIKIIYALYKSNYQKDKFIKKAQKHYDEMRQNQSDNQIYEFEIIPYDHIWEYILEILSQSKTRYHKKNYGN